MGEQLNSNLGFQARMDVMGFTEEWAAQNAEIRDHLARLDDNKAEAQANYTQQTNEGES